MHENELRRQHWLGNYPNCLLRKWREMGRQLALELLHGVRSLSWEIEVPPSPFHKRKSVLLA